MQYESEAIQSRSSVEFISRGLRVYASLSNEALD